MSEMLPIDDEALSGRVVMAYDPDLFWPIAAEFSEGRWRSIFDVPFELSPTHWFPIPDVPR